jgi:hypothetical protein
MDRILLSFRWLRGVSGVAVLAMAVAAPAQTPVAVGSGTGQIARTVEDVLHGMSDEADVIFVGQVVAIRPHDGDGLGSGFVEIDFEVDQAIRGCAGGAYALREWAGLWAGDANRYRVGQRLLMLLHAPGASGLSSPVGGLDGAIPIRGVADASPPGTAVENAPAPVADLRWLGAKVLHSSSYVLQAPLSAAPLTVEQQMAGSGEAVASPIVAPDDGSSRASTPVQQATVDTVVRLLSSWKKATADVR